MFIALNFRQNSRFSGNFSWTGRAKKKYFAAHGLEYCLYMGTSTGKFRQSTLILPKTSAMQSKLPALFLLFIYLNAYTHWTWPFLSDIAEHVFFHQYHIEHVHHGGANDQHVSHEIAESWSNSGEQDDQQHIPRETIVFYLAAHLILSPPDLLSRPEFLKTILNAPWRFDYTSVIGDVLCPPPKHGAQWNCNHS